MIVIVLVLAAPLTLWAIGRHFASIPSSSQETARRDQEVGRLVQAHKRRDEARKQAVQELLSQRCTLPQTLQRFQELNREWPDMIVMARVARAKESDEQIAYRLILAYVEMALSEQSEELVVVLHRLKNDYQKLQNDRQIAVR
jgi:hypothetical protein